jgi:hypothetical protein
LTYNDIKIIEWLSGNIALIAGKIFMRSIKILLMPDRYKLILFIIFVLITIAGYIQHTPIFESPPAQKASPLGDFSFTILALLLAFPYYIVIFALSLMGHIPFYRFNWLVPAGNIVYLYIFACLIVCGFYRYKRILLRWYWIAIACLPYSFVVLDLVFRHFPPIHLDDLLFYLIAPLFISLYVLILLLLGFFIGDKLTGKKGSIV